MIALLPHLVRLELNQRLLAGEADAALLAWLNGRTEEEGASDVRPPAATDLAAWRVGGYRDWLKRQETARAMRQLAEEVAELCPAGAEPATELLAAWLGCRYVAESHRLRECSAHPEGDWRRLREFCSDVATLRRLDQAAARLRLDREKFEEEGRERRAKEEAEKCPQAGPRGITRETLEKIEQAIGLL